MTEKFVKLCPDCRNLGKRIVALNLLDSLTSNNRDISVEAAESLYGGLVGDEVLLNREICGLALIAQVIANNSVLDPAKKSLLIGDARNIARDIYNCFELNGVNPDYLGKNTL